MSANTNVANRIGRWCREAAAGLAGVAVTLVGASTVMASMTNDSGFDSASPSDPASLVITPAHGRHLAAVEGDLGRVQLTDPQVVDGLHPGEAAYFGLTLSLRHSGEGQAARISVVPEVALSGSADLFYAVRIVDDATQCRQQWSQGSVVVPRRDITLAARDGFPIGGDGPPVPVCIRVVHSEDASDVETGAVTWRFVASGG